jgi:hypothetical protein
VTLLRGPCFLVQSICPQGLDCAGEDGGGARTAFHAACLHPSRRCGEAAQWFVPRGVEDGDYRRKMGAWISIMRRDRGRLFDRTRPAGLLRETKSSILTTVGYPSARHIQILPEFVRRFMDKLWTWPAARARALGGESGSELGGGSGI